MQSAAKGHSASWYRLPPPPAPAIDERVDRIRGSTRAAEKQFNDYAPSSGLPKIAACVSNAAQYDREVDASRFASKYDKIILVASGLCGDTTAPVVNRLCKGTAGGEKDRDEFNLPRPVSDHDGSLEFTGPVDTEFTSSLQDYEVMTARLVRRPGEPCG